MEFFKSLGTAVKRLPTPGFMKQKSTSLEALGALSGQDPATLAPLPEPTKVVFKRLFCGKHPLLEGVRDAEHTTITVVDSVDPADIEAMAVGFVDAGYPDLAAELLVAAATSPDIDSPGQQKFVASCLGIAGNPLGQRLGAASRLRLAGHAAFLSKFEDIDLGNGHPWQAFFDSIPPAELEAAHRAGHHRAFGELLSTIARAYESKQSPISLDELIALLKRFKDEAAKCRIEQLRVDVLRVVERIVEANKTLYKGRDVAAIETAFAGFAKDVELMKGCRLIAKAESADAASVKKLLSEPVLDHGYEFDVNLKNLQGRTALETAIDHKKLDVVQLLLEQPGIDPNIANRHGRSLLQRHAERGHYAVVKLLLKHPLIRVNQLTPDRRDSPLHAAIDEGDAEMVKLLLNHPHMDVNLVAFATPLDRASLKGDKEIIKLLEAKKALPGKGSIDYDNFY